MTGPDGSAYGSRTHDTGLKALGLNRLSNAPCRGKVYAPRYYPSVPLYGQSYLQVTALRPPSCVLVTIPDD